MRTLSLIVFAVLLSSCTLGTQPLEIPTPTLSAVLPTVAPTPETPRTAPAAEPTSTLLSASEDPFAANVLQLPAQDCTKTTPLQTEGPYYSPGSPEREILYEEGMPGEKLIVAGYVLDQNCQPISGAWLDFWQADANGVYDNSGFTLRGHQFTDSQGRYLLETVIPGQYPGRTEHIHVKIKPPNGTEITSQLYFPNVNANNSDGIFDPGLLVTLEAREGLYVAYYNFVLGQ